MKKNELLKFCRYYGRENLNDAESLCKHAEEVWLREAGGSEVSNVLVSLCDDFRYAGLLNYKEDDNVPISLKAVLFAMLGKTYSGSVADAAEYFKTFYETYYN